MLRRLRQTVDSKKSKAVPDVLSKLWICTYWDNVLEGKPREAEFPFQNIVLV